MAGVGNWIECDCKTDNGESQMKKWRVAGPDTDDDFETEAEALAHAGTLMDMLREEAKENGEWCDETECVVVMEVKHRAQIVERGTTDGGDVWVDYQIRQAP